MGRVSSFLYDAVVVVVVVVVVEVEPAGGTAHLSKAAEVRSPTGWYSQRMQRPIE